MHEILAREQLTPYFECPAFQPGLFVLCTGPKGVVSVVDWMRHPAAGHDGSTKRSWLKRIVSINSFDYIFESCCGYRSLPQRRGICGVGSALGNCNSALAADTVPSPEACLVKWELLVSRESHAGTQAKWVPVDILVVVEELGHGREVVVRHRRLMPPLLVVGWPRGCGREEHGLGSIAIEGAAETAVCAGSFNFRVVNHVTLIIIFMLYHNMLLAGAH